MSKSGRFEVRCEPEWLASIRGKAEEQGLTLSEYIRMMVALGQDAIAREKKDD